MLLLFLSFRDSLPLLVPFVVQMDVMCVRYETLSCQVKHVPFREVKLLLVDAGTGELVS